MITIQKGQEKTFQKYAREEMKLKLLNDILIDMEICKIEGWDRFVKENHTNFSKDANGIKYEFYEDDLLQFITQQRTELLEQILNLECLKEEKEKLIVGSYIKGRDENQLRKEIKEEITNDLFKDFKQVSNPLEEDKYENL